MGTRRTCALALLVTLLLAGCTDDPKPKRADPTPEPSPSSAASPSQSLELETAEDFIRRWQLAAFRMQTTGETSEFLALSHECETCERLADTIRAIYGSGATVTSSAPVMSHLKPVRTDKSAQTYTYRLVSDVAVVRSAGGDVQQRYLGGTERFKIRIGLRAGRWFVMSEDKI